jgi:hypothetical protein
MSKIHLTENGGQQLRFDTTPPIAAMPKVAAMAAGKRGAEARRRREGVVRVREFEKWLRASRHTPDGKWPQVAPPAIPSDADYAATRA